MPFLPFPFLFYNNYNNLHDFTKDKSPINIPSDFMIYAYNIRSMILLYK